jgi:hypothetical protein
MFAGIPELFLILVVVFAAWHVVKMFNRANTQRPRAPRPQAPPQQRQGQRVIEAEDLIACKSCGAYIAASARHCGRADCPQPR